MFVPVGAGIPRNLARSPKIGEAGEPDDYITIE